MRTFHIGGAASASVEQSSAISPIKGEVKLGNLKFINDTNNNKILLTRNAKVKIFFNNEEKFSLSIPFGSRIFFNDNDKVEANQLLADWDPYTLPIIAEKDGYIKYIDLKQGVSFRETIDDTTGISSKIIMDWSQNSKSKNLKPSISITDSFDQNIDSDESSKLNYPLVYNYDLNQKYTEISSIENLKIDAVVVNHVLMYMNKNKIDYLFKFIQELNPNAFFIIGISKQNFLSKIAMILSFNFDAHKGSITSYNEQISLIHTYFKIKKKYNIFFMTDIFYCVYKK